MKVSMLTEQLLQRWRNLIAETVSANLSVLQSEKGIKLIHDMRKTHNKIALAKLTMNRSILAITGRQGAGKTKLIRRFYNLNDEYLEDNEGRGEKIAILITESDIETPEGWVMRAVETNEGISIEENLLSASEFKKVAMDPAEQDVWLELRVPHKYFSENVSLALLPGFENDRDQRSQEFLLHMLRLSISSIVVVRKDLYPRQSSDNVFHVIKDIFKEVKPIFVLSHGDVNPEQNETMKNDLINDFGIAETEVDRVIISGDTAFKADWTHQLRASIDKYGFITKESERKQCEMLEKLFNEVTDQIISLQDFLKEEENNYKTQHSNWNRKDNIAKIVFDFQDIYENQLKILEDAMICELSTRRGPAKDSFNDYISKNKGLWNKVSSMFFANELEEQKKLRQAILEAWNNKDKKTEQVMVDVVTKDINRQAKGLGVTLMNSERPIETSLPMHTVQSESKVHVFPKESLQRINEFFDVAHDDGKIVTLRRDELKTLVLIGSVLCRQSLVAQPLLEQLHELQQSNLSPSLKKATLEKTMSEVNSFANAVQQMESIVPSLLKSIPIILGVDSLVDGENDILNNASKALEALGITLAPAHILGVLGAAFALTYGINAITHAVEETNKRQLMLSRAGSQVIDGLPELQAKAFIESLRRIFEKMANQLYEVHRNKMGVFDNYDDIEKIQYRLRGIRKLNAELQKAVINNATIFI